MSEPAIREARPDDLPRILEVIAAARAYMRAGGNTVQWTGGYPSAELLLGDIERGELYVEESDGRVTGCFTFITRPEPTYAEIEGEWPDSRPYGTIHRLASDGSRPGLARRCIAFCRGKIPRLRADTHEANKTMRHILERAGFRYCGVIRVADGTPRLAYQSGSEPE